jgi:hypothetical protein
MKDHVKLKVLVEDPLQLIPEIIRGLNEAKHSYQGESKKDSWHEIVFYLTEELVNLQIRAVDKWAESLKESRKGN